MRVNFSFFATVFVVLFVLGTVGCRSNGGPWYSPTSYAFTNPFAKDDVGRDSVAPTFGGGGSSLAANPQPSLVSQPDIGIPPGGYTDGTSLAGRSTGEMSQPPDAWGTQNPMVQHGQSNFGGGYSVPEPSQYSLSEAYAPPGATQASHPQGNPLMYHEPIHQASNTMSQTHHQQTALQQPANVPMGAIHEAWDQPGQHAPFVGNGMPQSDPYVVPQHQGTFSPGYYEQPMQHQAPVPQPQYPMGNTGPDPGMMVPQQQPAQQPPFWAH